MPHEFINWADFQNQLCCCLGGDVTPGPGAGDGGGSGSACVGLDSQPDAEVTHFSGDTACTVDVTGTYTYVDGDFESGENVGDFASDSFVVLTTTLTTKPGGCPCLQPINPTMEQLDFVSVVGQIVTFTSSLGWTVTWDYLTHLWEFSSATGASECITTINANVYNDFEAFTSGSISTLWFNDVTFCGSTSDTYTIDEVSNDTNYGDACCLYTWTLDGGSFDNYLNVWYCPVAHEWCALLDFDGTPSWGGADCMGVGGSKSAQIEITTSGSGQLNGTFTLDNTEGCESSIQVVLGSG